MICIFGPTAVGKTKLAVAVARKVGGEIISADSRQVYRRMDIGTGKDLADYEEVPYHLVDVAEPGEEYNLFRFQQDFIKAYEDILSRERKVVLCGGTGLYIDAVLRRYRLVEAPENEQLRHELVAHSLEQLVERLAKLRPLHNKTDTEDRERAIRAIEIALAEDALPDEAGRVPEIEYRAFLLELSREMVRERITLRLHERLKEGMVQEVKGLLTEGVPAERLMAYGLEYRFLTQYIKEEMSYEEMVKGLELAIHKFASRQARWFNRMERKGVKFTRLDGRRSLAELVSQVVGEARTIL